MISIIIDLHSLMPGSAKFSNVYIKKKEEIVHYENFFNIDYNSGGFL